MEEDLAEPLKTFQPLEDFLIPLSGDQALFNYVEVLFQDNVMF